MRLGQTCRLCYHIYSSQATIFYFSDTVFFSARSLTYEMLRWAVLPNHYCICGLLYSPMSGLSLRTLRFEDWCSRLVITKQLWMPSFISVLSHWTDDVSDGLYAWLWLSFLYCVMVIIALILVFVTCISMWCHDLAVIIIWTWMYLYYVLMSLLRLEVPNLYPLVLPSLGRIEVVIPTIVLAC